MESELVAHVAIPVAALTFGSVLMLYRSSSLLGRTAMYFGAQTGMNLYMKSVLSSSRVSESKRGMPAAFVVTALQQLTAFALFVCFIAASRATPWPYTPKALRTAKEWLAIALFTSSFVLNIALNNYSLSLIPISINMVIRSCLPLSTFAFQLMLSRLGSSRGSAAASKTQTSGQATPSDVSFMVAGALSAVVAVMAQHESVRVAGEPVSRFQLGVAICFVSNLSASVNLALAGLLGTDLQLNALDTAVYMSAPTVLFLLGPIFLIRHPISWVGEGAQTDWEVLRTVLAASPATVGLACLSGVFALAYNVLTYRIVHTLSAAHTAFAGSFNNAATILIATMVGLEHLPADPRCGAVLIVAVTGNVCAFAGYNMHKARGADLAQSSPDGGELLPMCESDADCTLDSAGPRALVPCEQSPGHRTCRSISLDATTPVPAASTFSRSTSIC